MNEALATWGLGVVMLCWGFWNRKDVDFQNKVYQKPNQYFFGFLGIAACFVVWQANALSAGRTMVPMLIITSIILVLLGLEAVYNKRSWTGGFWQYQIVAVFVFISVLLKTLIDMFTHEFVHYDFNWIPPDQMQQDLRQTLANPDVADFSKTGQQEELDEMEVGSFLRCVSGIGVLSSMICAGVVVFHFCELVVQLADCDHTQKYDFRKLHSSRPNLVLQIVLLPLIFVSLSLRSMLRVIRILNGSMLSDKAIAAGLNWQSALQFNEFIYDANLNLASAAEVWTISCLCFLCIDILQEKVRKANRERALLLEKGMAQYDPGQHVDVEDVANTLRNTSLQGVVSFVIVGLVQATVSLTITMTEVYQTVNTQQCEHDLTALQFLCLRKVKTLQQLQDVCQSLTPFLKPLMILTSLQCIWNMMSICGFRINVKIGKVQLFCFEPFKGMTEFREHDFDKRLTGVRMLILILQMQKAALTALQKVKIVPWSDMQVRLAHSSLICVECLGVALLQWHLWKWSAIEKLMQSKQHGEYQGESNDVPTAQKTKVDDSLPDKAQPLLPFPREQGLLST